jgi:hypothetical protein
MEELANQAREPSIKTTIAPGSRSTCCIYQNGSGKVVREGAERLVSVIRSLQRPVFPHFDTCETITASDDHKYVTDDFIMLA